VRALVTGAGGGIGAAVADHLEAAGVDVVRSDVVLDGVDVRRPDDVEALCAGAGDVDVLVNAAGTYGERVPFTASDPEAWWSVLETNLRGPALLCRRLVPGMVERGRGVVVNVASRAAVWDDPGASSVAYSTSKAALVRFTEALAAEVAGTGVLVVSLSPGFVRTGMTASRPGIDRMPDDAFLPASAIAERVVALAAGGHDALHGRFVHVLDDRPLRLALVD
jgi:NAD(P)-dependent dehydrogenase (short-subunit alcohol dehydrogenase family)